MNPIFFQYNFNNNILDDLVKEFADRDWIFKKKPKDYFHQYKWPNIVLSDKEAILKLPNELKNNHDKLIELLGCYECDSGSTNEGRVVLFIPKILDTTKEYIKYLKNDKAYNPNKEEIIKYVELLTSLVLIHEFTHWIVHIGVFPIYYDNKIEVKSNPLASKYNDIESVFFHETIAQIFTNYFCYKNIELKKMFNWLEERQPIQYQIYKKLFWENGVTYISENNNEITAPEDKLFHIEIKHAQLEIIIFSLMVLRVNSSQPQSFKDLQTIFNQTKNCDKIKHFFKHQIIQLFKNWDWNVEDFETFCKKYKSAMKFKQLGL